jgi:hypothetical protein
MSSSQVQLALSVLMDAVLYVKFSENEIERLYDNLVAV